MGKAHCREMFRARSAFAIVLKQFLAQRLLRLAHARTRGPVLALLQTVPSFAHGTRGRCGRR